MSDEIKSFRSTKFGDVYQFRFTQEQGNWAIFILKHPANPRGGSAHTTHILAGNRLCVTESPQSLNRAVALSHAWIDYFSKYIRTGSTKQVKVRATFKDA